MPKAVTQEEVARQLVAELLPGVSVAVLQDLHLLTRDGRLNADSRRKLKQVAHFLGFLRAPLEDVAARHAEPVVVDCAAGKAYLSLLLAEALLAPWAGARVYAIETRAELASGTRERAQRFGLTKLHAVHAEIAEATLPPRIHLVTALHACDTATDDALALAIRREADWVAVVPCCQAEVARQLSEHAPPDPALASLAGHAWHRRELGSHLTNVLRVLALEANGYKVTVTELAGWEHSLKNELILGKRVQRHDARAARELEGLLAATGVRPTLVRLLEARAPG
jgi:hypothetical protein